jgi:hypothetical protein
MRTKELAQVYNLLKGAKLSKMEDSDKIKVVVAMREIKKIVTPYNEAINDARESLKDGDFERSVGKLRDFKNLPDEDKVALNTYFQTYEENIAKAVSDIAESEHELQYERLSEDAFGKFIASNDFTIEQIMKLQDILM